jgi:GMP synthase-like glutamine amidotransferase
MICYVDIEHEKALSSAEKRIAHQAHCIDVKLRLEETSGDVCLVQHYKQVTRQWLSDLEIRALIISGNVTDWVEYDETDWLEMYGIIRSAELPILGICGGCQLIAMAHRVPSGPIRRLEEMESDPYEGLGAGYFKEWGFVAVHVLKADPLFNSLGEEPVFLAAHYEEVKAIPPGFELLASSDLCRIQAIRQIEKLVYGTQFHPEAYTKGQGDSQSWLVNLVYPEGYTEEQTDGRKLLLNFFQAAGILE